MNKSGTRKLEKEFGLENFCPFLDYVNRELFADYLYEMTENMKERVDSFIGTDISLAAELSIMIPHIIDDNIPESYKRKVGNELQQLWSEAASLWYLIGDLEDADAFPSMYRRIESERIFHIYQKSEVVFWDALLYLASDDEKLFRSTMSDLNMRISNLARYSCEPLGELVVVKLNALMEMEGESEEWKRTLSVNSYCHEVQDYRYDYYLEKGDAREAGLALRNIRDNLPPRKGTPVPQIETQLLALFEDAGMVEDVKRQLQHIFLCYEQEDLSYYLRYRELASDDEFDSVRSRLGRVQTYGLMDQVLAYEGKYDELLEYLRHNCSLTCLERNASVLASANPDGFCAVCENYIDRIMAVCRGKNEYFSVAEALAIMESVDHDRAQHKAEEVMRNNSRKRSLKQMILEKGFSAPTDL